MICCIAVSALLNQGAIGEQKNPVPAVRPRADDLFLRQSNNAGLYELHATSLYCIQLQMDSGAATASAAHDWFVRTFTNEIKGLAAVVEAHRDRVIQATRLVDRVDMAEISESMESNDSLFYYIYERGAEVGIIILTEDGKVRKKIVRGGSGTAPRTDRASTNVVANP
jgi:hypothetical protein